MNPLRRGLQYVIQTLIRLDLRVWGNPYSDTSEPVEDGVARDWETPTTSSAVRDMIVLRKRTKRILTRPTHPYIYHSPSQPTQPLQDLPDVRVRPYDPNKKDHEGKGGQTNWN
jgi:hypothetical protein